MSRGAAAVVAGVLLLAGCGAPDPEESSAVADDMREQVHETVRTLVEGLEAGGIEVTEATGGFSACGLKTPELEYGAGMGTTADSGSIPEQVEIAREVIEGLGLPMDDTDTPNYVSTDPIEGDLRVSAQPTPVEPGILVVEVVRDCVELDRDVVDSRLNEEVETIE